MKSLASLPSFTINAGNRTLFRVLLILSVLVVGLIDYLTGYEFELVIFYFIPVAITAWTERWRNVLFVAIISGVVWFASDYFAGSVHSYEFYRYWDGAMKIATFIIIGQTVYRTKQAMREKDEANQKLQKALDELRELREIVPICAYCKSVRNDKGYYERVETYLRRTTGQRFTHGICPECAKKLEEAEQTEE